MLGLAVPDNIGGSHLIDRLHASFVPYLVKPAPDQTAVFLRHKPPPRAGYPLWPLTVRSACKCCNACTWTSPRCKNAMPSAAARAADRVVIVGIRAITAARRI